MKFYTTTKWVDKETGECLPREPTEKYRVLDKEITYKKDDLRQTTEKTIYKIIDIYGKREKQLELFRD